MMCGATAEALAAPRAVASPRRATATPPHHHTTETAPFSRKGPFLRAETIDLDGNTPSDRVGHPF